MYSQKNCEVTHFDIVYELFIYYFRSLSTIKSLICDARVTRKHLFTVKIQLYDILHDITILYI